VTARYASVEGKRQTLIIPLLLRPMVARDAGHQVYFAPAMHTVQAKHVAFSLVQSGKPIYIL
jgi:hypothetical protein